VTRRCHRHAMAVWAENCNFIHDLLVAGAMTCNFCFRLKFLVSSYSSECLLCF
jgi:hypothetical protein